MCDTVYVTVKHDIRILEIAKKKDAFIVQKVQDMPAHDSDIGQVMVSPFPITDIRRQFRAAVDDIQRGAYIVRDGKDDILACFQQFIVLVYDTFHLVPEPYIPFQMLVDNQVREYQQDDCRNYQPRDDGGGVIVRLRNISFSVLGDAGTCTVSLPPNSPAMPFFFRTTVRGCIACRAASDR